MSRNCRFLSAMRLLRESSGCAPQALDQRVDGGRLGLHHPELGQKGAQVIHDFPGPDAGGLGDVPLEQRLEVRSEEHTSELQSQSNLVCRLLLEKKKQTT